MIALSDGERILMRQFGLGEVTPEHHRRARRIGWANVKPSSSIVSASGKGKLHRTTRSAATATGIAQGASADLVGFSTFDALPLSAEPARFVPSTRKDEPTSAYARVRWSVPYEAMDVSAALENRARVRRPRQRLDFPQFSEGMSALERAAHIDPLGRCADRRRPGSRPADLQRGCAGAGIWLTRTEAALDGDERGPT